MEIELKIIITTTKHWLLSGSKWSPCICCVYCYKKKRLHPKHNKSLTKQATASTVLSVSQQKTTAITDFVVTAVHDREETFLFTEASSQQLIPNVALFSQLAAPPANHNSLTPISENIMVKLHHDVMPQRKHECSQ